MHSLVTRITTARTARRMRQAEQIQALWAERRRRSTPVYAFGVAVR